MAKYYGTYRNPEKRARVEWMREYAPEELDSLIQSGTLDEYMDDMEQRYIDRLRELQPKCEEALGYDFMAGQDLADTDMRAWLAMKDQARRMASEIAFSEIVAPPMEDYPEV